MHWTLITGASRGLGKETALQLASLKIPLVLHTRQWNADAEDVVKACRSLGAVVELIQGDFSSPQETEKFLASYLSRFASTRGLVLNASHYYRGSLSSTPLLHLRAFNAS